MLGATGPSSSWPARRARSELTLCLRKAAIPVVHQAKGQVHLGDLMRPCNRQTVGFRAQRARSTHVAFHLHQTARAEGVVAGRRLAVGATAGSGAVQGGLLGSLAIARQMRDGRQRSEPSRCLRVETGQLGFANCLAQFSLELGGELAPEIAGTGNASGWGEGKGLQVQEGDLQAGAGFAFEKIDLCQALVGESDGLVVGKQAQRALGGSERGPHRYLGLATEGGMTHQTQRQRVVGVFFSDQGIGDLPVDQAASWQGDLRVGSPADQIVRKIVAA